MKRLGLAAYFLITSIRVEKDSSEIIVVLIAGIRVKLLKKSSTT